MMGSKTTQKFLIIYQFEKVFILSKKSLVCWLCDILKKHLHREQKNHGSQAVAWVLVSIRHPNIPQIRKFLPAIYPEI